MAWCCEPFVRRTHGTAVIRRVIAYTSVLLTTLVLLAPAQASGEASQFLGKLNGERTSRGLRAYAVRSDLNTVAARQASRMARAQRLYHNPDLGGEVSNWRALAENIGRGGSVSVVHEALMASGGHRAHILSSTYTEVGAGTAWGSDGKLYVAQVFRLPARATSVAPVPRVRRPSRASRSAPRRPPAVRTPATPARPRVDPLAGRLAAALAAVRRERPVGSIERLATYIRTMSRLS